VLNTSLCLQSSLCALYHALISMSSRLQTLIAVTMVIQNLCGKERLVAAPHPLHIGDLIQWCVVLADEPKQIQSAPIAVGGQTQSYQFIHRQSYEKANS